MTNDEAPYGVIALIVAFAIFAGGMVVGSDVRFFMKVCLGFFWVDEVL